MPSSNSSKIRPFLKWAGGKYAIADIIKEHLPEGKTLIEPFVGAGSIFLNTDYDKYILNDINEDLINLYIEIQHNGDRFITDAKKYFTQRYNSEKTYYTLRNRFNNSTDPYERSILFIYLNKFCYNGLCRYNQSGEFNVPFGKHKNPRFPMKHIENFSKKSNNVKFVCEDYKNTFKRARKSHVIYCDPPYAPLTDTANFSDYSTEGFNLDDQESLAQAAHNASKRGVTVVISNHDTTFVREIYKGAKTISLDVQRNISCKPSKRGKAKEVMAIFKGKS